MIGKANVLCLFGKSLIRASIKSSKVPSISGYYRFAEEKKK
jgi:hypothetical protein